MQKLSNTLNLRENINKYDKIVEKLKSENVSVLLVEQKIEGTLRISDRTVFLENGILKEETTPEKLNDNPEPLEKYVGVKSQKDGESPSYT